MNFRLVLISSALLLGMSSCNKDGNNLGTEEIPTAIFEAFENSYPNAQEVEWEYEDGYYEVEFELGDYEIEVTYDLNGNVIELEEEIAPSALPENVLGYISSNYPGSEIDEAELIIIDNSTYYEVEIETASNSELELVFDEDGNFLSVESDD